MSTAWRSARAGQSTTISPGSASAGSQPGTSTRSPRSTRVTGSSRSASPGGYRVARGVGPSWYQTKPVPTGATSSPTRALMSVDLPEHAGPVTAIRSAPSNRSIWWRIQSAASAWSRYIRRAVVSRYHARSASVALMRPRPRWRRW